MKYLITACAALALSACAVTDDITTKTALSEGDRRAVENIRTKTTAYCVSVNVNDGAPVPVVSGHTQFTTQAKITRLYMAREGWYKAMIVNQGVIGNVYFDPGTGRFICGQIEWDRNPNVAGMQFREINTPKP